MMNDDFRLRRFERFGSAMLAGASTAASVSFVAFVASGVSTQLFAGREKIESAIAVGIFLAIGVGFVGAVAGAVGGAVTNSLHAAGAGAMVFTVVAGYVVLVIPEAFGPVSERIWFLVPAWAIGGLSGGVGAIVARKVVEDDKESEPLRFSLRELLALCLLVAVLFGYVGHLIRR